MAETIIREIDAFVEQYPEAEYSFAHIVLSDYNLFDDSIRYCLRPHVVGQWWADVCQDHDMTEERRLIIRDATFDFLHHLLDDYSEEERVGCVD